MLNCKVALTLAELEAAACSGLTRLLAFHHSRIACKKTCLIESDGRLLGLSHKGHGRTEPYGGLAFNTTANYVDADSPRGGNSEAINDVAMGSSLKYSSIDDR